jgi:calmodulin
MGVSPSKASKAGRTAGGASPSKANQKSNPKNAASPEPVMTPADRLTEAQILEFREAFYAFDKDRSGYIDKDELKNLCAWVGQDATDADIDSMMVLADGDNSGKIDFWEFCTLMAHKMGDTNPDKTLRHAFRVFDNDGSGTISADELKDVMREMGEQIDESDMDSLMRCMDVNGDGQIDYEEFSDIVTKEMQMGGYMLT